MNCLRIAFVVQRYGLEVNGGAEALCRIMAERLARNHQVEVITTRAVDYVTWRDEYPEGMAEINGVVVRRFGVDSPRDSREFDAISHAVFGSNRTEEDEIRWMKLQGPYSSDLLDYLARNRESYDVFVFMTYLYATTYFGLPLVSDRAVLVPTAHDEWPIYLGIFDDVFRNAQALICSTPEELAFARRRFFGLELKADIVGVGFDAVPEQPPDPEWDILRQQIGDSEFILYLGRIDESKGCGTLMEFFQKYTAEYSQRRLKLVMVGKPVMPVPDHAQILAPGFVSDATKWRVLRACRFMVTPSPYESLCFAAVEAWLMRKPVLANGNCAVLKAQCIRSNGGLWYADYSEFRAGMNRLLEDDPLVFQLGDQGYDFAVKNYTWEEVDKKLLRIFTSVASCASGRTALATASAS